MSKDISRFLNCISNIADEEFESIEILKNTVVELIRKYFGVISKIEDLNDKTYIKIPTSDTNFIFDIKKEKEVYKINQYKIK